MAKYRQFIKTGKRKFVPLNRTFKTKGQAEKFTKARNKKRTKYVIGGRGFSDKQKAKKWLQWRINNPPIGFSSKEIKSKMKIKKSVGSDNILTYRKER